MKFSIKGQLIAIAVMISACCVVQAATQYGTGSFTWDDGITTAWGGTTGGPYTQVWTNGNDAVFEGAAGTVSIETNGVSAQNLTFDASGFTVRSNTLTLTGSPVVTANGDAVISAAVAGSVGLTKTGTADLVLSGVNTYSGETTVSEGMLQIGDGTTNPVLNDANYTIAAGATLKLYTDGLWDNIGQQMFFANLRGSGTLQLDSTAAVDWPGETAQYYMNFDAGFTGDLVIDRGRIPSNNGGMGGITNVIVNAGGQFASWNGGTFSHDMTIAGFYGDEPSHNIAVRTSNTGQTTTHNGNVTLAASTAMDAQGTGVFNGVISGAADADLTLTGGGSPGTIIFTADNTYEGSTIVKDGLTLQLGNGGSTGAISPVSSLNLATANSNLKINHSDTVTQGTDFGVIEGSGGVIKTGSGMLVLNSINGYTGSTVIEDGILKFEAPPQAFRYYRIHVLQNYGNNAYNQFSELHFYSNGVWTAAVGGYPATTDHNGETHWTKANDNNKDTKFGDDGVPYELTYDFGTPHFFDSYNWSTANDQTPSRNPIRWIIYGSNDNTTWSILSDMSDWNQMGPTTYFTWAGVDPDKYEAVTNGATAGGAANAYPLVTSMQIQPVTVNTSVKIADSGTLDLNGLNVTIASLDEAGTVTNSAGTPVTLTVNQSGDTIFGGVIADNGANAISLVKSGTGTLSLYGPNAYTGSTVINSGTLKMGLGFRYYKFLVDSVNGGGSYGLQYSEIDFYSSGTNPGNGNRVFPVTATGDGGSYKDQGIPGLYDGNLSTKSYMDPPFPRYVIYDFGTPKYFTGYDWASANDSTPQRNPDDWTVLGSNDGSTWSTIDSQTNSGGIPTDTFTYAPGWSFAPYSALQSSLPSTTTLQIDSGAVLDLNGSTQTIGLLSGSGSVTNGTLVVTDDIMPGGTNLVGALAIGAASITGALQIDVNTDGSCDALAASGDFDLSGLTLTVANPAQLKASQDYTVITCSGIRTGAFASVSVPEGWYVQYLPDGSVKLSYDGGTLLMIR